MHITIKTLQQQSFKIEVEPDDVVKTLKDKIATEKGDGFAAENQKLIYAGKILDDAKKISEYKIEESKFVVIMMSKAKPKATTEPVPAAAAASTTTAAPTATTSTSEPAPMDTASPATPKPTTDDEKAATADPAPTAMDTAAEPTAVVAEPAATAEVAAPPAGADSSLVTGQSYEVAIKEMTEMGFPREQAVRAMRASFNNPARAVDYLLNGIPDMPAEPEPAPVAAAATDAAAAPATTTAATATTAASTANTAPAGSAASTTAPASGASMEDSLAFLRQQPQFNQMRTLIQQNPALLPPFLQEIRQSNPRLLQMITENQERFVQMLNEPIPESPAPVAGGADAPAAGGALGGAGANQEGYISVTPDEKQAIDRLKALGFSERMCLQAYFACEKNEDLAANFLCSNLDFDDDDDQQLG